MSKTAWWVRFDSEAAGATHGSSHEFGSVTIKNTELPVNGQAIPPWFLSELYIHVRESFAIDKQII